MTAIYYASITDHRGTEILDLEYTATAKHSAFLATKFLNDCPPAIGFNIHKFCTDATFLAMLMNRKNPS